MFENDPYRQHFQSIFGAADQRSQPRSPMSSGPERRFANSQRPKEMPPEPTPEASSDPFRRHFENLLKPVELATKPLVRDSVEASKSMDFEKYMPPSARAPSPQPDYGNPQWTGGPQGIPGSSPVTQAPRDPISDRQSILAQSMFQPKVEVSAEAKFTQKEAEMRPDDTRVLTNYQQRYLAAIEKQTAAAEQAKEQAKWIMLAQLGFGLSSGRPDALSQVGPQALGNMYGVNRDYTTAQNSIADNYLRGAQMEREDSRNARTEKYQDLNYQLGKERLQAYRDSLKAASAGRENSGIAAAASIRQRAESQAAREFETIYGKPDGLSTFDPKVSSERARLFEEYKKKRVGEISANLANAYRGQAPESIFKSDFEEDVTQ